MNDKYASLRAALEAMAQFGAWHKTRSHINIDESDEWCAVQINVRANRDASRKVAGYLKEIRPATIHTLLADADRVEALDIIAQSIAASLARHGVADADGPGEAIDVLVAAKDAQITRLREALSDMVTAYEYEASAQNPSLLKARAALAQDQS